MKLGKKILAGGAIVLATMGILAPAANAGNSAFCTGSWVCVYKNSGFGIGLGARSAGFTLQNISDANDNEVSSWENRTGTNARWYTKSSGNGTCHDMAKYSELSWMSWAQNDNMSSWAGTRGC